MKQKKRLEDLKEKREKPKKRKIHTDPGNDDCGDDISGLGQDIEFHMLEFIIEEWSSDDGNEMFFQITAEAQEPQPSIADSPTSMCTTFLEC
eukprot:8454329-Karenia_brevis.AAC.1